MSIPKGYKLVPVEPTEEILTALINTWFAASPIDDREAMTQAYKAMLAAAPTPPQPIYDEAKEREDQRAALTNDDLIAIARNAALNSVDRYNYMPCLPAEAYAWEPHYWVIEAMRAALKPAEAARCCTVSAEDLALLEAGDYTPEELFGVGGALRARSAPSPNPTPRLLLVPAVTGTTDLLR